MSTEQAREAAAWACHRGLGWPTFSKKYIPPVRPAATITWPIMLAVPAPALPSRLSGCIVLDWTAHELDGAASAAAASGSCGLVPGPLTRSDPGANIATVVISACPWKTSYAEFLFFLKELYDGLAVAGARGLTVRHTNTWPWSEPHTTCLPSGEKLARIWALRLTSPLYLQHCWYSVVLYSLSLESLLVISTFVLSEGMYSMPHIFLLRPLAVQTSSWASYTRPMFWTL
mmetsp:Transcript_24760/g.63422  ORF Transcript_24760/g.63422 Transcript_24760/m.63422 type:complete len:230 (+) Transcript_24760:4717-5406(+)